MCKSAQRELRIFEERGGQDLEILWHGSLSFEEASLAYWFGENLRGDVIRRSVHDLRRILDEWAMAFCSGFRDIFPVFIRCKSADPVAGDPPARHLVKNTIELMPRYFEMSPARQAVTLLHEMGHRSTDVRRPRDERHNLCSGGWNRKKNICYRENDEVDDFEDLFSGGNPRVLAIASSGGNAGARKVAKNNIDNYVCYMWNRYLDRSEHNLVVLPPGGGKSAHKVFV